MRQQRATYGSPALPERHGDTDPVAVYDADSRIAEQAACEISSLIRACRGDAVANGDAPSGHCIRISPSQAQRLLDAADRTHKAALGVLDAVRLRRQELTGSERHLASPSDGSRAAIARSVSDSHAAA